MIYQFSNDILIHDDNVEYLNIYRLAYCDSRTKHHIYKCKNKTLKVKKKSYKNFKKCIIIKRQTIMHILNDKTFKLKYIGKFGLNNIVYRYFFFYFI